jgi:hypothetical protein
VLRKIGFVSVGAVAAAVAVLAGGSLGNSDKYFTVKIANGGTAPIKLFQCRASCQDLAQPEVVAPHSMTTETGSSTAHQPFMVSQVGDKARVCVDLFFVKKPARAVTITEPAGRLRVQGVPRC